MKSMSAIRRVMAVLLLSWSCGLSAESLLTGNGHPARPCNDPALSAPKVDTVATLEFLKDGPFACDKEFIATGSRPDGANRVLLDGLIGPEGDFQAYHTWGGGTGYASFVVDLKQPFQVSRVAVWSQETDVQGMESFELLLSFDGKDFVSMGSVVNDFKRKSKSDNLAVDFTMTLPSPVLARYLQFRIKKPQGRHSMVIAEVAAWGDAAGQTANQEQLLPENQRPVVNFDAKALSEGAVRLDWRKFAVANSQANGFAVYYSAQPFVKITDPGVALFGKFNKDATQTIIYPLTPGTAQYFAVTASYNGREFARVEPVKVMMPRPFERNNFGDMLAINHFWGGGGARGPARPHAQAWEQVALDMLAKTPYKQVRWWLANPEIVKKMYEDGLSLCTFPHDATLKDGLPLGVYSYSAGNEPDISGRPMTEYFNYLKKSYGQFKAANPNAVISAPTCGLEERSLVWLDEFYKMGAKDYFDVMDVHSYVKAAAEFKMPDGYPKAAPEGLYYLIPKLRAVMAKYGDGDKPLISTEYGYTDCPVANPAGLITPEQKAAYLVRGLAIHYVLGFQRVFVYSFWDEGDDPNYTEHYFGLVSYDLQMKPAYYASCVLGDVLGKCTTFEPVKNMALPDIGYNFYDPERKGYTAMIWNGAAERAGKFKTAPCKVEVVSMLGNHSSVQTDAEGRFRLRFGAAPVYVLSAAPVELESAVNVQKSEQSLSRRPLEVSLDKTVFTALAGESAVPVKYEIVNRDDQTYNVKVMLENADKKVIAQTVVNIAPRCKYQGSFDSPFNSKVLSPVTLAIGYDTEYDSFYEEVSGFVRQLTAKPGVRQVAMHSLEQKVYSLDSNVLEVTLDPARGGRVLEILDRADGGNQINLDYAKIGVLASIDFAYAIWDRLDCNDRAYSVGRNAVYQVTQTGDNFIEMTAGDKLVFTKRYTLEGGKITLSLTVRNKTESDQTFHYYMHPEYTVGGSGDNVTDELVLPIGGKELVMPFWTGLGEKRIDQLNKGWWRVVDTVSKVKLEQEFDLAAYQNPRLWFGIGAYNLEMETKPVTLAPGAAWSQKLIWNFSR